MTGWTPDRWETMARDAAHALPPIDHGSTRAIQDVARLLREAYQIGRNEARAEEEAGGRLVPAESNRKVQP